MFATYTADCNYKKEKTRQKLNRKNKSTTKPVGIFAQRSRFTNGGTPI